ncbi:ABC transporter substrate-binding protein [Vulcanisaeta distributa]|uniref:ABC transporter substrate-binding protein n=1 Tax=Vulcanisaeta distributa TaxID=164451 RepID=UPI0006D203DD|nr:ABC transporter substrate-binding protein [Vulcanisaeta distributa]
MLSKVSRKYVLIATITLVIALVLVLISIPRSYAQQTLTFPRNETLYIGGAMWSPPSNGFNPIVYPPTSEELYLVYLTLFTYDPFNDSLIPLLAQSMSVYNSTAVIINLRPQATWSNGQPVTAQDVVFTLELGKNYTCTRWSWVWGTWTGALKNAVALNQTSVMLVFVGKINWYALYQEILTDMQVVPASVWSSVSNPCTWTNPPATSPPYTISDGPYEGYYYSDTEQVYIKNPNWWGWSVFGINPDYPPEYVVSMVATSNVQAPSLIAQGMLDWNGFFIMNVWQYYNESFYTFYTHPPYQVPINVVALWINYQQYPWDIPAVRRAVAFAINTTELAVIAENNQEAPDGAWPGPTTELFNAFGPYFQEVINTTILKEYGWYYDPNESIAIFESLGFHKNAQGYWVTPNGTVLSLTIMAPAGWTDWDEQAELIAEMLQAVGIDATVVTPSWSTFWSDLQTGQFQAALWNPSGLLPVTYFNNWGYYWGCVSPTIAWCDFERFNNLTYNLLVQQLMYTNPSNLSAVLPLYSRLEEIFLQTVPVIPLVYGSAWYGYSTKYWVGWPNQNNPGVAWPSPWSGSGEVWVVLGLKPVSAVKPKPAVSISSSLLMTIIIIVVVIVIIIAIVAWLAVRRRRR